MILKIEFSNVLSLTTQVRSGENNLVTKLDLYEWSKIKK